MFARKQFTISYPPHYTCSVYNMFATYLPVTGVSLTTDIGMGFVSIPASVSVTVALSASGEEEPFRITFITVVHGFPSLKSTTWR
jgi:hypothetical protein